MRIRIFLGTISVLLIALFSSTGCVGYNDGTLNKKAIADLAWLAKAEPRRDAQAAVNKNDLRFLAVNGAAAGTIPAIDQFGVDRDLVVLYGTRLLAGTCATSYSHKHEKLQTEAWEYAKTYNTLLLQYLRSRR